MNALTKAQKAQVRAIMKSNEWDAVLAFAGKKLDAWREERVAGNNEFETLKSLFTRDGKVEGLLEFLNQLESEATE